VTMDGSVYVLTGEQLCGGRFTCPSDQVCVQGGPNPDAGLVNFDHIGYGFFTIFNAITMEGWSIIMFRTQDSVHSITWMYWVLIIVVGRYV